MALAVSLTNMQTAARQRAAMENGANNQFVSTSELTGYLNYGLNELYDKLIAARGEEYYRNAYSFNSVANQSLYALPADFYQLISVDINLGGTMILSGKRYMEYQRNMFKWYPGWYLTVPVYYSLIGSNINFLPTPTGTYAVTLNYVPAFIPLVLGSDTFDGVSGWEEYAIWRAVKFMLAKEESDTSTADQELAMLDVRISNLANQRHAGDAPRIRDCESEQEWGFNGSGW